MGEIEETWAPDGKVAYAFNQEIDSSQDIFLRYACVLITIFIVEFWGFPQSDTL